MGSIVVVRHSTTSIKGNGVPERTIKVPRFTFGRKAPIIDLAEEDQSIKNDKSIEKQHTEDTQTANSIAVDAQQDNSIKTPDTPVGSHPTPQVIVEESTEEEVQARHKSFVKRISHDYFNIKTEILPSVTGRQIRSRYHELPVPQSMFTRLLHVVQQVVNPAALSEIPGYPWRLSAAVAKDIGADKAADSLLDKNAVLYGIGEAKRLMHYPAYDFPKSFLVEAEQNIVELFELLSDPKTAGNVNSLLPLMSKRIAVEYCKGARNLHSQGQYVKLEPLEQFTVTLKYCHFTYGPYPVPRNHTKKSFAGHSDFWIPTEDASKIDVNDLDDALDFAKSEGCYFRVGVRTDGEIRCTLFDSSNDTPIVSDVRDSVDIEFITPHFDPWDPIYEHQPDSTWKLRFRWRVSDIDGLVKSLLEKEQERRMKTQIETKGYYLPEQDP